MSAGEIDALANQLGEALRKAKHDEDCIAFVVDRFRVQMVAAYVPIEITYPPDLAGVVARIRDQHQEATGQHLKACIESWIEVWRLRRQVLMQPNRLQAQ